MEKSLVAKLKETLASHPFDYLEFKKPKGNLLDPEEYEERGNDIKFNDPEAETGFISKHA